MIFSQKINQLRLPIRNLISTPFRSIAKPTGDPALDLKIKNVKKDKPFPPLVICGPPCSGKVFFLRIEFIDYSNRAFYL